MNVRAKPPARRGYTLFELLLTLGLAAALLVLITAAIGLFEKYASAGRARAERAQVARALLDKMEMDLRCIVYRERPADAENDTKAVVTLGALDVNLEFKTKQPGDEYRNASLGIIGDERQLLLHVDSTPRANESGVQSPNAQPGLHYVIWAVSAHPGAMHSGEISNRPLAATSVPQPGRHSQAGLARYTVDPLLSRINLGESVSPASMLAGEKHGGVMAGEVQAIRYRYRDWGGWQNVWNSVTVGRLPRAIEVTLEFDSRDEISDGPNHLRVVIPITLSEPFVPQSAAPATTGVP